MDEPMDYRTAIGIQAAFERLRYFEGLVSKYQAEAREASDRHEEAVATNLLHQYETAVTAIRWTLATFEGSFAAGSPDGLSAMADAAHPPVSV